MRAIRKFSLTLAATAILLVLAVALTSLGANSLFTQSSAPKPSARAAVAQAMKTYTMYSGLWRTDGGFISTIRVKNVLVVAPMDITPVLFMADGTPYPLRSVHLAVSGVATINVNDALANAPSSISAHASTFGSAALIHTYSSPGHVSASMAVIDASRSLSYTFPFAEPMGASMQQTLEGLWWKHDPNVSGWLSLSNVSNAATQATVQLVGPGNAAQPGRTIALAPNTTQMFHLEDFASNPSPLLKDAGGIRLRYTGQPGSVQVSGGLENDAEGYSANIPFWGLDMSSTAATTITYAFAGLMLGNPDPMMMPGFPKDTTFTPYLVLRNTTEKPLDATLQLNYMKGMGGSSMGTNSSAPITRNLPLQHLAPGEAKQVDMRAVLNSAGLASINSFINLSVSFIGKAGNLILASGSVDQSGTYVFEVEPQGVSTSRIKFTNYWGVANGNDTMFSLWNPTDTAQDIVATFYYGDGSGKYTLPVHLEPQASTMIDMAMLIMEMKPDASGNIIPPSIQEGSAQFASAKGPHEQMTLVIAGGIYNVVDATCGITCIYCCGYSNYGINPSPIYCPIGESWGLTSTAVDCNGNPVPPSSWASSNTSVMTVDSFGNVHGVAVGSANITAEWLFAPATTGQVCSAGPAECPTENPQSGAQGDVTPTVSGPNTVWYFSNLDVSGYTTSAQLTANGGDSSTTWNITAGANKITVSAFTGSSINVLSSGTAFSSSVGDVTLTATANGQTSAPFSLTTRTPNSLVPGTPTTSCDSTYGHMTVVPYTIQDQLLSALPSDVPLNENWTTSLIVDYTGSNWTRPSPGYATSDGASFGDFISGQALSSSPNPVPTCDGNSTRVQHTGQEWRIGTIATGIGRRVQTDTLQDYIGYGAHLSIVSPAP